MDALLMVAYVVFVFCIGMVWGWCIARDRFDGDSYQQGFNEGWAAGERYLRYELDGDESKDLIDDDLPF